MGKIDTLTMNIYRAWDKQDKRMIVHEQDLIPVKVTSAGVFRLNALHEADFWELMPKERFDIMRYSGVRDMKGKDRCEGDIIKRNTGYIFVEQALRFSVGKSSAFGYSYDSEDLIIGNIHENPELIP